MQKIDFSLNVTKLRDRMNEPKGGAPNAVPTKLKLYSPPSKDHALANDIYLYFNKQIPFPLLIASVKRLGWQYIFESFKQSKEGKKPIALFQHLLKEVKIEYR